VFHTDNGTEFTAELVMKLIREWNTSYKIVTGRRRMPRDQGSVNRVNGFVKTFIAMLEHEERNKGNNNRARQWFCEKFHREVGTRGKEQRKQ
jgi:hypothetical protein